jgi:hypothetical protein
LKGKGRKVLQPEEQSDRSISGRHGTVIDSNEDDKHVEDSIRLSYQSNSNEIDEID